MNFFGPTLRKLSSRNEIYLTFDDGPDPDLTPRVLDLLEKYSAKATFFVISQLAEKENTLIQRMIEEGHAIGDHSLDHNYRHFFRGQAHMDQWLEESDALLQDICQKPTVGFRPPNGIHTPQLHRTLKEQDRALILWSERFFDRVWGWKKEKAIQSAKSINPGTIVLLHDVQREKNQSEFLEALEGFLVAFSERNLHCAPVPDGLTYSSQS